MRRQLLLVITVLTIVTNVHAQWIKIFTGSVEERTSIGVFPDGALIIAGVNFLSYTEDGGDTWEFFTLDFFTDVRSLSVFGDSSIFMITSGNKLWKTTDRCATLNYYPVGFEGIIGLMAIDFPSADTGYIAGNSNTIFKSVDGGITWDTILDEATGESFYDIHFFDSNHGITCDYDGTFRITYDGGDNWETVLSPFTNPIYDIEFISDSVGYACTSNGEICKTSDQGENWVSLKSGSGSTKAVCFSNEQEGMIANNDGHYYFTIDSGETWEYSLSGVDFFQDVLDIQFDGGYYYASCSNGDIFKTPSPLIPLLVQTQMPDEIALYPNPAADFLNVQFDETKGWDEIIIYDSYGRLVIQQFVQPDIAVSINMLPNGLYFSKLTGRNGNSSKQFSFNIGR